MYKKIVFIFIIVVFCIILSLIFKKEPKETYTLDELKDYLKQTETMVICLYDAHNPYEICTNEDIIESITDKSKIDQIISYIMPLEALSGAYPAVGAGLVIHSLEEKENLVINAFYAPYIGIEKGDSFYSLSRDSSLIQNIAEILDIDDEKLLNAVNQT